MKILYIKSDKWKSLPEKPSHEDNILILSYNDWDDYGYKTTLNARLYIGSECILEFGLKVLIKQIDFTALHLNKLIENHWSGYFPIPQSEYVSVPSNIDFYSILLSKFDVKETLEILKLVKDATFLKNIENDSTATELIESDAFNTSLLREGGSRKAFNDGWILFVDNKTSTIEDFTLNIRTKNNLSIPIDLKFNSPILPYDINVLIGPNGIGKSYCLKSLVEYWLGVNSGSKDILSKNNHIPFSKAPNIARLILFSYSPFEEFNLDLVDTPLQDKDVYKYFGFRQNIERDGEVRVGINRNLPSRDSVQSILKALEDDEKFGFMKDWIGKIDVINDVLKHAINYDQLALELNEKALSEAPLISLILDKSNIINSNNVTYYLLNSDSYNSLQDPNRLDFFNANSGVVFLKNEQRVELSSGQRLFCYIVINLAGEIKKDSLVVIDEPELFLHLTLEIKFMHLLKKVLKAFNSKAILATHSLAIARETPRNCVHVFREIEDGLDVINPPFETFGSDMQRISSYVFGDDSITKPFDEWISSKLVECDGNKDALIQKLGKEINEETLMTILNFGE